MLVSIIIPTYNRASYLDEALASVFQQDYEDFEVIVIDDGSTDGTRAVIEKYASDARLRYEYQQNSGKPSIARNRGLQIARGEYVAFLDSDDLLSPGSIANRVNFLDNHPSVCMVSAGWDYFFDEFSPNKLKQSEIPHNFIRDLPDAYTTEITEDHVVFNSDVIFELVDSDLINASTVMMRREVIEQVGVFDETLRICEDYDLWVRIAGRFTIAFMHSTGSFRRKHVGAITCDTELNFSDDAVVLERIAKTYRSENPLVNSRFRNKMAQFYRKYATTLYHRGKYSESHNKFKRAYRLVKSPDLIKYCLVTLLPASVLECVLKAKTCLRSANKS